MKTSRTYVMTTRAEAAQRTRVRILDALVELAAHRVLADISLADVALTAGVSVQTVLRRFGNRAGLIDAAFLHAFTDVRTERQTPVGDVPRAIAVLVDHYEARGDAVVLLLAQEASDAQVRFMTENGRRLHREWVQAAFEPHLPALEVSRVALLDLLVVVTDVYTWKLLRRDRGLDRTTTQQRMHQLVAALIGTE